MREGLLASMNVKVCFVAIMLSAFATAISAVGLNQACTNNANCTIANTTCTGAAGSKTCTCSSGYKAKSTNCEPIKGLTDNCSGDTDCSDSIGNAVCTAGKCACAVTYSAKKGACVLAVSQTTCSAGGKECDGITNAECDITPKVLKCKCKSGFTENINQCQEKSGAVSTTTFIGMVFFPLMVLLSDKLFM